jgi:ribosome-interacting GTPase 1
MPANLPPDYFAAEQRYRTAKTPADKIACLEEMLMVMPKHKGTDKLKADLRRRISKHRQEAQTKRALSKRDLAFRVEKEGAGQVVVIGPANTGKSSVVAVLTNARPAVAEFPCSTWRPMPGMVTVRGMPIQLVDTPPLDAEHVEPELFELIRHADLALIVVDLATDPMAQVERTVSILEKRRIIPRHLQERYTEPVVWSALPFLVLANKYDDESCEENVEIFGELAGETWPFVAASTTTGRNLEKLREALPVAMQIIRVFSKPRGKDVDLNDPFVVRKGCTVEEFASKVHQDFADQLKVARIWGTGVYDGQMVQRDHVLQDGDVVELVI